MRLLLLALLSSPMLALAHGPHEHGHISVDMAIDSKDVAVEITGPAQSFIGFEHKAKNKLEENKIKQTEKLLVDKAVSLIGLPATLGCKVSVYNIQWIADEDHDHDEHEADKDEKHHGEHSDLKASYKFTCQQEVKNTKLTVGLKKSFPNIHEIEFAVLPSHGTAFSVELKDSQESVTLP